MKKVAIIGAGISGLFIANLLKKNPNYQITLYEKNTSIAIMPNDFIKYPEDNFENMKIFAKENKFNFPYLIDESQNIAKNFGAVCTPDFFGYNQEGKLNYRGRIGEMNNLQFVNEKNELLEAMIMISIKNKGPETQYPSAGCSIKWKN